MRRVSLLFNPMAGRNREGRSLVIEKVATALRNAGCEVEVISTEAPGTAGPQARHACDRGAEIVFACGGDGTVHEVLQGMVFQPRASLGVVPLGSANALARHLRLLQDPVRAVLQQLSWQSRLLPVGKVQYTTDAGSASRYFAVIAGAGADGALVYQMLSGNKERFGRVSYYARAALLVLNKPFPTFETKLPSDGQASRKAVSAIAVRVGDLGGAFSPLVRGGSLEEPSLRIAIATGPGRTSLSSWFALSWLGLAKLNRHVRLSDTAVFEAGAGANGARIQVQADGEWLGRTPMSLNIVPDAFRLLVPSHPV